MRAFYAEGQIETEDGTKLTLVADFYTIDIVEQITGENWDDIVPQLGAGPPKSLVVKVLYGLLRKRHDGIELNDVAGLTYDKNAIAIFAVMGDVIRRACNIPDDVEETEDEPAKPAKKKPSGRSRGSAKSG